MNVYNKLSATGATMLLSLPSIVAAQTGFAGPTGDFGTGSGTGIGIFVTNVVTFVNSILLPAVLAIAFLVFVWGIFVYFIAGGADEEKRSQGKNLMIYATLGFVFIVIFWGLVNFVANSLGLQGDDLTTPSTVTVPQ